MPHLSLGWQGPVVWWHPVDGHRHALPPDLRPEPGQHRHTLCQQPVTLPELSDADWFLPTCDDCMTHALTRRDQRSARRRRHRDHDQHDHDQRRTNHDDTGNSGNPNDSGHPDEPGRRKP